MAWRGASRRFRRLAFIQARPDLWIAAQRLRSAAAAGGSSLRTAGPVRAAASGSSASVRRRGVPSASAARPRSPARGRARSRGSGSRPAPTSAVVRRRPPRRRPRRPTAPSSRIPGVSRISAPEGSRISSRCVVVWRPCASSSRIARVAIQLGAGERVDERRLADPRRAQQHRGLAGASMAPTAPPAPGRSGPRPPAPARRRRSPRPRRPAVGVVAGVGLGEQDHRRGPAL